MSHPRTKDKKTARQRIGIPMYVLGTVGEESSGGVIVPAGVILAARGASVTHAVFGPPYLHSVYRRLSGRKGRSSALFPYAISASKFGYSGKFHAILPLYSF